jgi:hypothetical protein
MTKWRRICWTEMSQERGSWKKKIYIYNFSFGLSEGRDKMRDLGIEGGY